MGHDRYTIAPRFPYKIILFTNIAEASILLLPNSQMLLQVKRRVLDNECN